MKKKSIFLFFIFLVITSCSNMDSQITGETDDKNIREGLFSNEENKILEVLASGSIKYTEKEAIDKALEAIGSIYEISTRATDTRTIKNFCVLTNQTESRSTNDKNIDTLAYVLNFNNNAGYVIVAADKRVSEQILVCTGEGNLKLETDNPGLSIFLAQAEDYILESIEKSEQMKDSLSQVILNKLLTKSSQVSERMGIELESLDDVDILIDFTYGPWETVGIVAPLTAVEWGQNHNTYTKIKGCDGNAPYTGCVATATAQIMAYWKHPVLIDGYTMNWSEMTLYTDGFYRNSLFNYKWKESVSNAPTNVRNNVARLMERIGSNVGMNYKCDGSGAKTENAVAWLKKIGYLGGEKTSYNFYDVKKSLDAKRIVMADGYCFEEKDKFLGITVNTSYKSGHAWNYDGYLIRKRKVTRKTTTISQKTGYVLDVTTSINYENRSLVHVNWGWNGYSNGYYYTGVFDTNKPEELPSSTRNTSELEGQEGYYKYKLSIYTNIKK